MKTSATFLTLLIAFFIADTAVAQEGKPKSRIKIIKIVDGDTTITEKELDESEMPYVEKEVSTSKDGENVAVKVIIHKEGAEGVSHDEEMMKNFDFNFTFDTAGMGKVFEKKIFLGDSLLKFDDKEMEEMIKKMDIQWKGLDSSHAFMFNSNGGKCLISSDSIHKIIMKSMDGLKEGKSGYMYMFSDDDDKGHKTHVSPCVVKIIDLDEKKGKEKERSKAAEKKAPAIGKVDFYPNPSQGNFSLDFEITGNEPTLITVSDINGKEVYREEVKGKGKYNKKIDLGERSKGIYLLKLKQGDKVTTKKLIIE